MAETDFKSMAYSLIPAAFGIMTGGALGGAAGFARGVGDLDDERQRESKYQDEQRIKLENQELKQSENARQEQELVLNRGAHARADKQLGLQEENWKVANDLSRVHGKLYEAQRQRSELDLQILKDNEGAIKTLAGQIKDPVERAKFIRDPKAYEDEKLEKTLRKSLGEQAAALRIPGGRGLLEAMDSKKGADFMADLIKSRNEQKPFHFFSESTGTLYYGDGRNPGAIQSKKLQEPKATLGKDQEIVVANEISKRAEAQVNAPLPKTQLGEVRLGDEWGATIEARDAKYKAVLQQRKNELAAEVGMPNLFNQQIKKPVDALTEADRAGHIKSTSEAVAFLVNRGMKADEAVKTVEQINEAKKRNPAGATSATGAPY